MNNTSQASPVFPQRVGAFVSILVMAFVLGGCATPVTQQAMVPASIDTLKKHVQTVSIEVSGGQPTEAIGKSQISNEAFTSALTEAINTSKTFSQVIQGGSANYLLTVSMISIDQPSFGFSFTVKMETGWTLKRVDTGAIVWQEGIRSDHTAAASDAFAGVTRLRMATEGAANKNIAQGLGKISRLSL